LKRFIEILHQLFKAGDLGKSDFDVPQWAYIQVKPVAAIFDISVTTGFKAPIARYKIGCMERTINSRSMRAILLGMNAM
jgi:hypothetical protein